MSANTLMRWKKVVMSFPWIESRTSDAREKNTSRTVARASRRVMPELRHKKSAPGGKLGAL
jgi:hypothetical protein